MELSDNQLIRRINGGDREQYGVLVDRYKSTIFNLMYRYSGSVEEASDMTQDVFCRAYEKLDKYGERNSYFSWLYTLALNYARDWSRKKRLHERKMESLALDEYIDDTSPALEVEAKREIESLKKALNLLKDDRRELVILRYRHDCSIRELSEIFAISESAVKMRLQRALGELGQIMIGS